MKKHRRTKDEELMILRLERQKIKELLKEVLELLKEGE